MADLESLEEIFRETTSSPASEKCGPNMPPPMPPMPPKGPELTEQQKRRIARNKMTAAEQDLLDQAEEDATANAKGIMVPSRLDPSKEAECADCRDLKWLARHPWPDRPWQSEVVPCHCTNTERVTKFMSVVAGEQAVKRYTFAAFRLAMNPTMEPALKDSKQFARREGPPWLALIGDTGCGKTHLALAIAAIYVENGYGVVFKTAPDLLAEIKATFNDQSGETLQAAVRRYQGTDLLVLDEYGMEKITDWTQEQLETILVFRAQRGMRTVLASNDPSKSSPRVWSRIRDRTLCAAPDLSQAVDVRSRLKAG